MKDRIKYLDKLRLFAILNIILLHVIAIFRWKYFGMDTTRFFIMTFLDSFTRVGIPIFFMLTGILMFQKEEEPYKEFFQKRVLKLIIAYFLIGIVYYIYNGITIHTPISIYEFLREATSGTIIYHLWYMPVIILIYMMIPFLRKMILHLNQKECQNLIGIIFVLSNCFLGISSLLASRDYYLLQNFTLPNLIGYTNYVFLGYYLNKYDIKITKKLVIISILSILFIPIGTLYVSRTGINDVYLDSLSLFVFFPSILVFLLFKKYPILNLSKEIEKLLEKNIHCIFYVYLVHVLVLSIIQNQMLDLIRRTNLLGDFLLIIFLFIVVSFLSFIISYLWIDFKKWFQKNFHTISKIFMIIISYLFIFLFTLVLGNLLLNPYDFIKFNFLETILGIAVICSLIYLLFRIQNRIQGMKWLKIVCIILYIIFQIVVINLFAVKPSWDFGQVYEIAKNFATSSHPVITHDYLYVCDNNIAISILLDIVLKIGALIGFKSHLLSVGITFNTIMIDLTFFYIYLFLKKLSKEWSKPYMVFCLFFTPLVFYLPIFYTDTITLPFIVIPLYYLSNYFFENEKEYYIIISGLLFGIGGVIKPTVLIPFIAIILYAICSKKNAFIWKLVGVVIILLLGYKVFVHHFFVQEYFENARIPKNHYIMIGLEKDGGFSQEAYEYTIQYSGEQARKEADNKRIQERIKEMIQKHQVIPFYNRKMSYTWTDGTFFAYEKLRRDPYHPENTKYILSTKEDHWYWLMANAEWIIILCLMIMGTIFRKHLPKKLRDMQWILNTSIIGLFLFLLLWETRSRYLVNFSPIFLLNAYIGLIAMKEKWNDKEKAK